MVGSRRRDPGAREFFRRRPAGGRDDDEVEAKRIKKWLKRILLGTVLLALSGWLVGAWLLRRWTAKPPPLLRDVAILQLERGKFNPARVRELQAFGRANAEFHLVVFPEGTRGDGVQAGPCQPGRHAGDN